MVLKWPQEPQQWSPSGLYFMRTSPYPDTSERKSQNWTLLALIGLIRTTANPDLITVARRMDAQGPDGSTWVESGRGLDP